jgi:hypothetical protein
MTPSFLRAATALLFLAPFAAAQFGGGGMGGSFGSSSSGDTPTGGSSSRGLPGLPMTPPPVDHPALAAQPLINGDNESSSRRPAPSQPAAPMPACEPAPSDPDTFGPKVAGKDMKKAVAAVKKLNWLEDLADAKAMSAATGKPILWLQALGDIDGFA